MIKKIFLNPVSFIRTNLAVVSEYYLRHSFLSISLKFVYSRHKVQCRAIIQFSLRSSGYCEQMRSLLKDVASQRNYLVLTKCSRVLGASKALERQVVNLGISLDSICAATWWAQSSCGSSLLSSCSPFFIHSTPQR